MKSLIIQLCDTSVAFCHYPKSHRSPKLIDLKVLREGLIWAMKNGLSIHILYPEYNIPQEYLQCIQEFEHIVITSKTYSPDDITVFSGCETLISDCDYHSSPVILRTRISDFINNVQQLSQALSNYSRINITFTDIQDFSKLRENEYEDCLRILSQRISDLYFYGSYVQLNLLTDRCMLTEMNNCNAGVDNVTLSPDGKFYICPGFYLDGDNSIGSLDKGLNIPNGQLLELQFAPICRQCDAFHCRRCVWLNKKTTLEINTPSYEQCIMAHIERRVSSELLRIIRQYGSFAPDVSIPKINYNDPLEKILKYY